MTDSQYISVRETAQLLGISEKKVMDMIDEKKLQAYRIANQFLRLKKSEVVGLRNSGSITNESVRFPYSFRERVKDFFYYNDFYLLATIIILTLLYVIFYL
ncbi:MAG: helix-turn-helix domain-containing protein [Candidatus Omnitrophica bacterium]|nr:helix-turn-helix domain-containing protein [Candidatus Omnitrophota bacterium]